jgi:hypothetical protein
MRLDYAFGVLLWKIVIGALVVLAIGVNIRSKWEAWKQAAQLHKLNKSVLGVNQQATRAEQARALLEAQTSWKMERYRGALGWYMFVFVCVAIQSFFGAVISGFLFYQVASLEASGKEILAIFSIMCSLICVFCVTQILILRRLKREKHSV